MKILKLDQRLVELRTDAGLSLAEAARRAAMSRKTLERLETGQTGDPEFSTVIKLADMYRCPVDYLAGRDRSNDYLDYIYAGDLSPENRAIARQFIEALADKQW